MKKNPSLAFVADKTEQAQKSLLYFQNHYPNVDLEEADVIVVLGGDGFMLHTLHQSIHQGKYFYGMNRGSVGFLMNRYSEADLLERLEHAVMTTLFPLEMTAEVFQDGIKKRLAINEVYLLRETAQAAKIRVDVDGITRIEELVCDGVMVATSAGSTAYNFSAHGPILPIGSGLLALTPVSAFRPRRWRGALLPHRATVEFHILDPEKRPVSAVADNLEVRDVRYVRVHEDQSRPLNLLFDPEHHLEERILNEQFSDF